MGAAAVGIGGGVGAARRVARIGVEQALAHVGPVVHFDVAHVERVAVLVDEAAHGMDGVGHLAELDAVEPVGWIEQRERADIAEALRADLAEAA